MSIESAIGPGSDFSAIPQDVAGEVARTVKIRLIDNFPYPVIKYTIFISDIYINDNLKEAGDMNRQDIIQLLHEFDAEIKTPLRIEICGSSCAIILYGLNRTTCDIDVMRSSMPWSDSRIISAIEAVETAGKIASKIDWAAADLIEKGNKTIAGKDAEFRRGTGKDYGLDF